MCVVAPPIHRLWLPFELLHLCCILFDAVCGPDQFECGIGECVSEDVVCNGERDCSNGRDEPNDCQSKCIANILVYW